MLYYIYADRRKKQRDAEGMFCDFIIHRYCVMLIFDICFVNRPRTPAKPKKVGDDAEDDEQMATPNKSGQKARSKNRLRKYNITCL